MIIPNQLSHLFNIDYPIFQAPMAGGYTSAELVAAVSNSGGLGSIAAGYWDAATLAEEIKKVKELTTKSYCVNLFVPHRTYVSTDDIQKFINKASEIFPDIDTNNTKYLFKESSWEITSLNPMIDIIIELEVPIVSFTFGVPSDEIIARLKDHNIRIIGNATHVLEAYLWQNKDVDALILQGSEAGGHRATFIGEPLSVAQSSFSLIQQCIRLIDIPLIAAGGYFDAKSMGAAFCLGASGVSSGTAFLTTDEANTSEEHKDLLINSNELDSEFANIFSGAYARTLKTTGFKTLQKYDLPQLPFPAHGFLIKTLIAKQGLEEFKSIYCGINAQFCEKVSAMELMERWIVELKRL